MLNLRTCVVVVAVLLVGGVALAQTSETADIAALRVRANAGDANAQFILGLAYADGEGVPQDDAQAVSWFRKSAEQGDSGAQHFLGGVYRNGQGVPQDYVESHKWHNLAASRASAEDQERYAEIRDVLASLMTPQQIADAQQLAREWLAAFEQRN